jgi:hypothetical protein
MTQIVDGGWRSIADQACNEVDPEKLMILPRSFAALESNRKQKSQSAAASRGNGPGSFPGD